MAFRGLIDYEELQFMSASMFEMDEQGRATVYSEYLQYYCETAMDYVDIMEEHDLECDFSYKALQGMVLAVMLFHTGNIKVGIDPEDSFALVKEQVAGYYLFSMYNHFVAQGYRGSVRVNEDGTGLKLVVDDGEEEVCEYDVIKRLDKAFDLMQVEESEDGYSLSFNPEEMIEVIYR